VEVTFSFAGSKDLVEQMNGGAPADVFASADAKNMDTAAADGLVTGSGSFASNTLTLVTPADNPGGITGLDSSLEGHSLVVCAEGVPCGNATKTLTEKLGITLSPVSEEQSVTDVLGKVTSGQADAGIVYVTDAASAGDSVTTIAIRDADEVVNDYRIAVTSSTTDAAGAQAFLDAVNSTEGQAILARHGFGSPLT
jgi:molybdenum ABC transporter, periplasmic molybdate-binding protein